jgi:hypothetical protein
MEWIKSVAVGSFLKISGSTSYCDFTSDTITVSRGGNYNVTITPQFWQGTRTEYYKIWMDINQDGDFADSNEEIFSAGPTTLPATGSAIIPVTSNTGYTRLRVAMRYNAAPTAPCGSYSFGEVEDYTVKVKCNLVTSTSDSGNGSLRNVSSCVEDGEAVLFAPSLNNQTINVTGGPISADGLWKWLPPNNSNITVKASGNTTRILNIPAGTSVEIQNLKLIGGTAGSGSAIDNAGTLTLKDCDIHAAAGSSNPPLKNSGTLHIQGATDIRQ